MSKIKSALTRKWGPLPAWAWFAIVGGVYYFYRKYSATASGTGTGSVGPAAATPQPQTVLQPGESVYDPNSGSLTTAPGGSSSGDGSGGATTSSAADLAAAMDALANAIATGMPPTQVQVTVPGPTTPGTSGTAPPIRRVPKPPKRKKPENTYPKEAPVRPKKGKSRGRSKATINPGGKRRVAAKPAPVGSKAPSNGGKGRGRSTGGVSPAPPRVHQRPRTPVVTYVPTQRRTGGMQPGRRAEAAPAPRPSAPPPRTHRGNRGRK